VTTSRKASLHLLAIPKGWFDIKSVFTRMLD
jgi:hypothetical protein